MPRTALTIRESLVVIAICFGTFIASSTRYVASGFPATGFDDWELIVTTLLQIAFAVAAIMYLRWRGFEVASLVPRPSGATLAKGVLLCLATWVMGFVVTLPIMGGQGDGHAEKILFNSVVTVSIVAATAAVNGFYEETFLLGVLQRGQSHHGCSFAIALPLLVRLSYHTYQGPVGVIAVGVFGAILAAYYLRTRDLGAPIFAHILADMAPLMGA